MRDRGAGVSEGSTPGYGIRESISHRMAEVGGSAEIGPGHRARYDRPAPLAGLPAQPRRPDRSGLRPDDELVGRSGDREHRRLSDAAWRRPRSALHVTLTASRSWVTPVVAGALVVAALLARRRVVRSAPTWPRLVGWGLAMGALASSGWWRVGRGPWATSGPSPSGSRRCPCCCSPMSRRLATHPSWSSRSSGRWRWRRRSTGPRASSTRSAASRPAWSSPSVRSRWGSWCGAPRPGPRSSRAGSSSPTARRSARSTWSARAATTSSTPRSAILPWLESVADGRADVTTDEARETGHPAGGGGARRPLRPRRLRRHLRSLVTDYRRRGGVVVVRAGVAPGASRRTSGRLLRRCWSKTCLPRTGSPSRPSPTASASSGRTRLPADLRARAGRREHPALHPTGRRVRPCSASSRPPPNRGFHRRARAGRTFS